MACRVSHAVAEAVSSCLVLGGISLKVRPQIVGEGVLLRHVYIEDVGQAWLDFRFWQFEVECCATVVEISIEADQTMQKEILHDKQALHRRLYSIPTSSIKINGKRINYFNFLSSLEYVGCNRALERMMPRIDMNKIENIILNTPGIDQAEKEFYTGILKARKENILDYSANQLSREKGAITLTKELKRTVDRSLAAKEISSTEAAKKYSEVQNSQSGKDEILNEPNVKAADDSHFEGSSDNACL